MSNPDRSLKARGDQLVQWPFTFYLLCCVSFTWCFMFRNRVIGYLPALFDKYGNKILINHCIPHHHHHHHHHQQQQQDQQQRQEYIVHVDKEDYNNDGNGGS
jgi:hypothetical protein